MRRWSAERARHTGSNSWTAKRVQSLVWDVGLQAEVLQLS